MQIWVRDHLYHTLSIGSIMMDHIVQRIVDGRLLNNKQIIEENNNAS